MTWREDFEAMRDCIKEGAPAYECQITKYDFPKVMRFAELLREVKGVHLDDDVIDKLWQQAKAEAGK